MMTALTLGLLFVVVLLVASLRKTARDQKELWRRLISISPMPSRIRLAAEYGVTDIGPGRVSLLTPYGTDAATLEFTTVPGTLTSFPGRETTYEVAVGSGFDITYTPPPTPDELSPPHTRLEFRNATLTTRTQGATVKTVEW